MWSGAAAAAARTVSPPLHAPTSLTGRRGAGRPSTVSVRAGGGGLMDFVGGDLVKPDLGRWLDDVEEHKALAIYPPHEGGYEGRYLNRLRYQGYYFLDLSARGLGDPESTLTKIHPVCPPSLGRQPVARWYFPPEVDYRLSLLHPDAKGLIVWVYEAKVSPILSPLSHVAHRLCCFSSLSRVRSVCRFCPRPSCSSWPCSPTSAPKSG
uniref:NAD(P)H-quinone oxidoreductase subunit N, chloroplastic n=1 Tax=Triticum urartu TaxID=4572 RepID=A0A8R7PY40_TRIUA